MRIKVSVSKSKNTTNYYIIRDYTKNNKRSTAIVERLGNYDKIN